jgi:hypothetical protein
VTENEEPNDTNDDDATPPPGAPKETAPRYSRRLSDKILISFHQACDQNDFDVARQLLSVYEFMLTRRDVPAEANRRRSLDSLVAAHERLWYLRNPEQN